MTSEALAGGTTLVLLASKQAAVLASDSAQHEGNGGRLCDLQKVTPIGARFLVGVAGTCAVHAGPGDDPLDLQVSIPPLVDRYPWDDPDEDAMKFLEAVRAEVLRLEKRTYKGPSPTNLTPGVTVLVAGASGQTTFGVKIRFPGAFVAIGENHQLSFGIPEKQVRVATNGQLWAFIVTTTDDIHDTAMRFLKRQETDTRYPAMADLRAGPKTETALRAAATEAVRLTMDLDASIGGDIQVASVVPAGNGVHP